MKIIYRTSALRNLTITLACTLIMILLGVSALHTTAAPNKQEIKILPIGDSITAGYNANQGGENYQAAYRLPLYYLLQNNPEYKFTFIGTISSTYNAGFYQLSDKPVDHTKIRYVAKPSKTASQIWGEDKWGVTNLTRTDLAGDVWALIHVGTNDVNKMKDWEEETKLYLNKIITRLREYKNPKITVFLATIIPVNNPAEVKDPNTTCTAGVNFAAICTNLTNERIRVFNDNLRAWCNPDSQSICQTWPKDANFMVYLVDQYHSLTTLKHETLASILSGGKDNVHPNKRGEAYMALTWFGALDLHVSDALRWPGSNFCDKWGLLDASRCDDNDTPIITPTPKGKIRIIKEVVGQSPTDDWAFSGSWDFTLPAVGGSKLYSQLISKDYSIVEAPRDGWEQAVTCSNGVHGINSVTIHLKIDEVVSCTFTNRNTKPNENISVVNDRYDVAKDKVLYVDSPGVLANDLPVNGEPRVYYQTDGRQIYELGLYNDMWHNRHITTDPAFPLPAGKSMAALAVTNAPQLYYAASDGHVHYLAWNYADRDWHYAGDITAQVGGPPPVDGTLTPVTVNDNPRVYYLASDGDVHELAWVIDTWHYRNVTRAASGPPAIGGSALGVSTITNDDPRVYYLAEGADGLHLHELAWRSLTHVWYDGDLTAIVAGDSLPLDRRAQGGGTTPLGVMTADHYPRVAYLAAVNGETHVVEYYWDRDEYRYKYNDISATAVDQPTGNRTAQPNPGSPLIATTVDQQGDPRLYYQGRVADAGDAHIYELGRYAEQWHFRDVTGDGAGLPPNLDSLMATTAAGSLPQVYYFNDRTIHQLAWHSPNNWQDMNLGSDPAWPKAILDSPLSGITVKEQSLSAMLLSDVAHGDLDFYDDGSFVYTPSPGFTGRDSFTYAATTGTAESAATTVELEVTDECAPVDNNLIRNFCFSAGRAEWRFYHNDESAKEGAFTVSTDQPFAGTAAAQIAIRAPGTNVQFYQKGLTLEPNTTYELAFAAYSNSGEDMRVFLHKHTREPDGKTISYGLRTDIVPLESYWKSFTFTFTTLDRPDMNDARLRFWFAPYAQAGTVYQIDRVLLRKTSDIYGSAEPVMASAIDEDFERELLAGAEVPDEPAAEGQMQLYLPLVSSE